MLRCLPTVIIYSRFILLALSVFIIGLLASLPLSKGGPRQFYKTKLFIKIVWWIPIFAVVLLYLRSNDYGRAALLFLLLLGGISELWMHRKPALYQWEVLWFAVYASGLVYVLLFPHAFGQRWGDNYLVSVWYGSVLSDVGAFFLGSYLGKHRLPKLLNNKKSWEGVLGQLLGAALGITLLRMFVAPLAPWWLIAPIGIGSAAGDLLNSYVKRRHGIKEWSQAIPGHGGYLDRFGSFAVAAALSFFALLIH